jgi:hypothetical protein
MRIPDVEVLRVVSVMPAGGYKLRVRFSDGAEGVVSLEGRLRGAAFEPLRDVLLFEGAYVDGSGGVAWPNGADIDPEVLYSELQVSGPVVRRSFRRSFEEAARDKAEIVARLPELSRFFGLVVRMFYDDHARAHFHAEYAGATATITIRDGNVETHGFPPRALRLLEEWRVLHAHDLMENWRRMRDGELPLPIAPLE